MEEEKKKKKKKRTAVTILLDILIVILLGVFIYSGVRIGKTIYNHRHNAVQQNKVSEIFYGNTTEADAAVNASGAGQGSQNEVGQIDRLEPLILQNPDTFGWIKMKDTPIDYVVVQGKDNDQYLHADFFGEYNFAGTCFLDANNVVGGDLQNLIIYGHRMQDGSMFGTLAKYLEDRSYFEKHPSFDLTLKDGTYQCDIFAIVQTTTDHEWWITGFGTQQAKDEYVARAISSSYYKCNVTVAPEDQIVTLSTCDYELDDFKGRLLVMAKMTKKDQ